MRSNPRALLHLQAPCPLCHGKGYLDPPRRRRHDPPVLVGDLMCRNCGQRGVVSVVVRRVDVERALKGERPNEPDH